MDFIRQPFSPVFGAKISLFIGLLFSVFVVKAQVPFDCDNGVYLLNNTFGGPTLYRIDYTANGNEIEEIAFYPEWSNLNAIGFRITDRMIYARSQVNGDLLRIDAEGTIEILDTINNFYTNSADVTIDGHYFVCVNDAFNGLIKIDLTDSSFPYDTTFLTAISGNTAFTCTDVAFHPQTGILYGYDANKGQLVTIDMESGIIDDVFYPQTPYKIQMPALYFDAFGQLWGMTNNEIENKAEFFQINIQTGEVTPNQLVNGLLGGKDGCRCPKTLEFELLATPTLIEACNEITLTYVIENFTGTTLREVNFEHLLPQGFKVIQVFRNPFGGTVSDLGASDFKIQNMSIPFWKDSLVLRVGIEEEALGTHYLQANMELTNRPLLGILVTDNPNTEAPEDYVKVQITPNDKVTDCGFDIITDSRVNTFVANAFTPNNDGVNDVFFIQSHRLIKVRTFQIFDRLGEKVFEAKNFKSNNERYGWNGTLNGKPLNPGFFVWFAEVEYSDGKTERLQGEVMLMR